MAWRRHGLLVDPASIPWAASHAALPILDSRPGRPDRVYVSARDAQNRARIGHVEVDLDARRITGVSERPALGLGRPGTFDDSGVTGSTLVPVPGGGLHLYYSGWTRGVTVPFYFFIGCAVSHDGGDTFERVSEAPVLGRDVHDPYLTASPSILVEDGRWRMWYCSGTGWSDSSPPEPRYLIRYAESSDGIDWTRDGTVCIAPRDAGETNFGRPHVLHDGDRYRMWFPVRGPAYRIGHAESRDGLDWTRSDEDGLEPGTGWEANMVAYPWVVRRGRGLLMLYNGDGYGRTGVGLAESAPA